MQSSDILYDMNTKIIDGNLVRSLIFQSLAHDIRTYTQKYSAQPPLLSFILVGSRPESVSYVQIKKKACQELGIRIWAEEVPEETSESEVLRLIDQFNASSEVNGTIVQLPLPKHMNEETVLDRVDFARDVDGLTSYNMSRTFMKHRRPLFAPCTPLGIIELLKHYHIPITGKQAVVIGRSNIVGRPIAAMLLREHATVTVCHKRTQDLAEHTRKADILVICAGHAGLITGDMIKPGAVVLDVGINPILTPEGKRKIIGDADFDSCKQIASYITPVPGGVGPMTIAMLMRNTVDSWKRILESRSS
jgi:methylenetetrahydrofolate dehydrogenase (NADP+)/methenyltetrahydrofolate cyclohydrolase